jgi:pimeloyl-ACP methyl ester carboxylesterase
VAAVSMAAVSMAAVSMAAVLSCGGVTDDASGELVSRSALLESAAPESSLGFEEGSRATPRVPQLDWADCGQGFECATAAAPLDYARPRGRQIQLALTRLPARDGARRIGSLFVNFGGPGGDTVGALHDFGGALLERLNERFDIVGFDPRGTGQTSGAFDCKVNQEQLGLFAQPFATPEGPSAHALVQRAQDYIDACLDQGSELLPYASTADVARDMDLLRAAVGDRKLSYLGFSYGTFLGATYASLFPDRYRALVLDGAVDADEYINHPSAGWRTQTAAFELALGRFFEACAANQAACLGFGGSDPRGAFDQLVARADQEHISAGEDARAVSGSDLLLGAFVTLYAKENWSFLSSALAAAAAGEGRVARALADAFYGLQADGTYDPASDRFFLLAGAEPRYDREVATYLSAGAEAWAAFPHFWMNTGYGELPFALLPVHAKNAFYGPFVAAPRAPTVLVVGTTYDPATPYRDAELMTAELGNAALLTMQGDGHTAYGGRSACIDLAVEGYLEQGTLPPVGTRCAQDTAFEAPPAEPVAEAVAGGEARRASRFGRR